MCFSAKASFLAWCILSFMSLILWFRNKRYDRALAGFIFIIGLIQLVEYFIHIQSLDKNTAGKSLYLILWLQCLVLAGGVYLFIKGKGAATTGGGGSGVFTNIALGNLILFAFIFISAVVLAFTVYNYSFSGAPGKSGHVEWYRDGKPLLGTSGIFYLFGIFFPLLLLFLYYAIVVKKFDLGMLLLILYGILSACYVWKTFPPQAFSSMWCFLAVGFAFLVWSLDIFN